jgi:gas vesicle structural protein
MTVSPYEGSGPVQRSSGSALVDVVDTILDKGLVIDAFVRVSLVGIELITIDARIVVASVDTYLRFAEAVGRIDLEASHESPVELARSAGYRFTKAATQGALDEVSERISRAMSPSAANRQTLERVAP